MGPHYFLSYAPRGCILRHFICGWVFYLQLSEIPAIFCSFLDPFTSCTSPIRTGGCIFHWVSRQQLPYLATGRRQLAYKGRLCELRRLSRIMRDAGIKAATRPTDRPMVGNLVRFLRKTVWAESA
jgi:hypothetical protein